MLKTTTPSKITKRLDPKNYHQIVKWYLEGRSLSEVADIASIAYDVHLSVHTVHNIVEKSRRHYGKKDLNDRHALILDELAKIDRLENEYWLAWHRSLEFSTKTDSERLVSSDPNDNLSTSEHNLQTDANSTLGDDDASDNDSEENSESGTTEFDTNNKLSGSNNKLSGSNNTEDDPSSVWGGWARIDHAENNDATRLWPNFYNPRNKKSRRRYEFTEAAHYNEIEAAQQLKPPQYQFTRKIVETCGDPRFLAGIERCVDRRIKLLGLDAPNRNLNVTTNIENMRQFAREFALERGLDPDLILDDVMADAQLLYKSMKASNDDTQLPQQPKPRTTIALNPGEYGER